ncbi:hypothetical protein GMI69_01165 [Eggerthellaceae bacterium zg-887]|uniref:hypothetical protein n=1 Tax=Xiamenia xianingshaonis TaxID=2682776 RepID=UPI00140CF0AB|nr:hypothetical protein [Xiamenia xianingshaonis]NHM15285.1 hypothetical protein [Xiamenia xianingshaonis]
MIISMIAKLFEPKDKKFTLLSCMMQDDMRGSFSFAHLPKTLLGRPMCLRRAKVGKDVTRKVG